MKSFTDNQIVLIGNLTVMTVPQLIGYAEMAKSLFSESIPPKPSKRELVEIILTRIGDEDECSSRFQHEGDVKVERRLALIRALVTNRVVSAHWFPKLLEKLRE